MKKKVVALLLVVSGVFSLHASEIDYGFEFNLGLIYSTGFSDSVGDAYPGYSHDRGKGFLDLEAGVPINFGQISVIPKLSYMISGVEVNDWTGSDTYYTHLVMPSVAGRYYFNEGSSFYAEGELGYNIAISKNKDRYDYDNGFGVGAFVGYSYDGFSFGKLKFDVGYRYLPVDVKIKATGKKDSYNFGGFMFRVGMTF